MTAAAAALPLHPRRDALVRNLVIGLIAFLTLVDLFATQAILPTLVAHYGVSRAAMSGGSSVPACGTEKMSGPEPACRS